MSLAPLVADGKVMVGVSGGELSVRGFVAAFDAETGKPLWKTYTIPAPGEPGSETWPKGDQWDRRQLGVDRRRLRSRDRASVSGTPAMAGRGWGSSSRGITFTPHPCWR